MYECFVFNVLSIPVGDKMGKKLQLKRRVKYLTIFGTAHYMYVPTLSFTSIEYALKNFGVTEIYEIFVELQVDWS